MKQLDRPEPAWLKYTRGCNPPPTPFERRMSRYRAIVNAAFQRQTCALIRTITANALLTILVNYLLQKGYL